MIEGLIYLVKVVRGKYFALRLPSFVRRNYEAKANAALEKVGLGWVLSFVAFLRCRRRLRTPLSLSLSPLWLCFVTTTSVSN